MSASVHDIHGLRVSVEVSGLEGAPSSGALVPVVVDFPRVVEGGPVALGVRLCARSRSGSAVDALADGAPLFFHGRTRVLLGATALSVTDGWSRITVSLDGARVDGELDPRSLEDGYSFAHATMFIAIMLALHAHGLFHVHAGAVVAPSGELLLIAGEGGSGKTSTTLAFLGAGWDYLGDDALFLALRGGAPVALRVPKVFHVHPRSLSAHPELAPLLGPVFRANHDKHALDPLRAFSGRARTAAEAPRRLLFPRVTGRPETTMVALPQAEALGELVRSSALAMMPELPRGAEHLALLGRVASGARAYALELGLDALEDPTLVPRLLARHAEGR